MTGLPPLGAGAGRGAVSGGQQCEAAGERGWLVAGDVEPARFLLGDVGVGADVDDVDPLDASSWRCSMARAMTPRATRVLPRPVSSATRNRLCLSGP